MSCFCSTPTTSQGTYTQLPPKHYLIGDYTFASSSNLDSVPYIEHLLCFFSPTRATRPGFNPNQRHRRPYLRISRGGLQLDLNRQPRRISKMGRRLGFYLVHSQRQSQSGQAMCVGSLQRPKMAFFDGNMGAGAALEPNFSSTSRFNGGL